MARSICSGITCCTARPKACGRIRYSIRLITPRKCPISARKIRSCISSASARSAATNRIRNSTARSIGAKTLTWLPKKSELTRGECHRLQAILLVVGEHALETLQCDLNRQDRAPGRIEPRLDGFQPRHRRARHRTGAVRLEVVSRSAERLLYVGQCGALLLIRLNGSVDFIDRPADRREGGAAGVQADFVVSRSDFVAT